MLLGDPAASVMLPSKFMLRAYENRVVRGGLSGDLGSLERRHRRPNAQSRKARGVQGGQSHGDIRIMAQAAAEAG